MRSSTFGCSVRLGLLALSIVALPVGAYAQPDPSIGTWKLNPAKSKYSPGPGPQSTTVMIEAVGDQTKVTVKGVAADGSATGTAYTYRLDGKDYPVTGTADYDSVALKRSGNTIEGTRKKAGAVVQTYKRVISQDGKTMTVTTTGTNAQGQKFDNVSVYEKQ